ncbi:hypothetical protein [uncultured Nostoc sp.]|uniref:hypothetical protein n=1 Tax=uncultured Nostoc sp. TaxID=340711 RepID=UPI0035CC1A37
MGILRQVLAKRSLKTKYTAIAIIVRILALIPSCFQVKRGTLCAIKVLYLPISACDR